MERVIAVRLTFWPQEVQAYPMVEFWTQGSRPDVWPYVRMCQPPVPEGAEWLDVLRLATGSQMLAWRNRDLVDAWIEQNAVVRDSGKAAWCIDDDQTGGIDSKPLEQLLDLVRPAWRELLE